MAACHDNLQRQLDEIEALRATYPEDEGCLTFAPEELEAIGAVQTALQNPHVPLFKLPNISGTIRLPGVMLGQAPMALRFQLPSGYPSTAAPRLLIECTASRWLHEHLTAAVQLAAQQALGNESLLLLLGQLQEEAHKLSSQQQHVQPGCGNSAHLADATVATAAAASCNAESLEIIGITNAGPAQHTSNSSMHCDVQQQQPQQQCAHDLLRVVVWFHHIKNTNKRKNIVAWARELGIGGYSKPGFPGVLIAEGHSVDVREYLSRIRGLSWQAMQVRGEQMIQCSRCAAGATDGFDVLEDSNLIRCNKRAEASSSYNLTASEVNGQKNIAVTTAPRVFSGRFAELSETSGLGELGQLCTAAGVEDLFLKALKIAR